MNKKEYNRLKNSIPDFDTRYVREVSPKSIRYDQKTSQVRARGHVVQNIASMADLLKQKGNSSFLPPASVFVDGDNNLIEKDGITRIEACRKAGLAVSVSTYHSEQFGNDSWEWKKFQAQMNEHDEISQSNTESDMKKFISDCFHNGDLEKELGFKYKTDPRVFLKKGAKWIKNNIYPNNPKHTNWIRNRLKETLRSSYSASYENYTTEQAIKHYTSFSGTGCTSTEVGPEKATNNIILRVCNSYERLAPNMIGYIEENFVGYPTFETHIIFYHKSLAAATDNTIHKARADLDNWYQKHKRKYEDIYGVSCPFKVYVLPQIKSGENADDFKSIACL